MVSLMSDSNSSTYPLRRKLPSLSAKIVYWRRTLSLIWTAAPNWTLAWSVLLVAQGVLPLAGVYVLKLLVDSLVKAVKSGGD